MVRIIPLRKVEELRVLDERRIWVRFDDGREGIQDFSEILEEGGPLLETLRDPAVFKGAFVEGGCPTWPNGYDIAPTSLYREMDEAGLLGPRPDMPPLILHGDDVWKIGINEFEDPFIEVHIGGGRVAHLIFSTEAAHQFLTTFSDVVDRADALARASKAEPLEETIRRVKRERRREQQNDS